MRVKKTNSSTLAIKSRQVIGKPWDINLVKDTIHWRIHQELAVPLPEQLQSNPPVANEVAGALLVRELSGGTTIVMSNAPIGAPQCRGLVWKSSKAVTGPTNGPTRWR